MQIAPPLLVPLELVPLSVLHRRAAVARRSLGAAQAREVLARHVDLDAVPHLTSPGCCRIGAPKWAVSAAAMVAQGGGAPKRSASDPTSRAAARRICETVGPLPSRFLVA